MITVLHEAYNLEHQSTALPSDFCTRVRRTISMVASQFCIVLCIAVVVSVTAAEDLRRSSQRNSDWPSHGGPGLENHREAFRERKIDPRSVRGFGKKWEFLSGADVTTTPAVSKGVVYFPSYNGNLYAVSAATGKLIWMQNLTRLTAGIPEIDGQNFVSKLYNLSMYSRTTPVVVGGILLIGLSSPGVVIAVKKSSGSLVWSSLLDAHPYAIITASGTAFEGHYYVGTSSFEETRVVGCCTFIGGVYKLELATGRIVWRVGMAPDNGGVAGRYAGNAVWSSSPPIDKVRRLLYVSTGNSYSTPPEVTECRLRNPMNVTNPSLEDPCVAMDDYTTAVVAIRLDSGRVAWGKNLGGSDVFVFACLVDGPGSPNCPKSPGEDYDFGMSPLLLTVHPEDVLSRDILVVGQKSGFVWALDRGSGQQVWVTVAGPGGSLGGASWGMTTDGKRVFTNILNNGREEFKLLPSTKSVRGGGWVAMDAATGKIIWTTANPDNFTTNPPLTHANGVVFGGSNGGAPNAPVPGRVVAMDTKTGDVLWTHPMPGPMAGGVAVVDGVVYVGSGANQAFAALLRTPPYSGKSVLAFSADYHH